MVGRGLTEEAGLPSSSTKVSANTRAWPVYGSPVEKRVFWLEQP